ncbi:MAG: hypothetical protein AAF411_13020 [Myxococcota bacterium]
MKRAILVMALLAACGGDSEEQARAERPVVAESTGGERVEGENRCDANAENREVSEYDTSGDEYPDVRKVFLTVGEGRLARLVLICREADLNGDGTKDVVRHYNDEGRPLREEADRNFDGRMDEITFFDNGRIIRKEVDTNGSGIVDTKIFYENGRPLRTERDMAGRSTATNWQPDRWEYFEGGRMVRMGTDLDGDGRVDRWDRDAEWQRQQEAERARQAAEAAAAEEGGDEEGGDEAEG